MIRVPYYVRAAALGISAFFLGVHLWTWILVAPAGIRQGKYDFRQSYGAGVLVRTGQARELYDYQAQKRVQDERVSPAPIALPFIAPPYEALLFAPLAGFPFLTAYFIFLAVNLALVGAAFYLMRPAMTNLAGVYRWLPAALFLGFLPLAAALIEGQRSILLLIALVVAFRLLERDHEFGAGLVVALALFKYPLILPLALLFLLWRRWKFVAGFALVAAVLVALSVSLVGLHGAREYSSITVSLSNASSAGGDENVKLIRAAIPGGVAWRHMANARGLIDGFTRSWLSAERQSVRVLVVSFLVIAFAWMRGKHLSKADRLLLALVAASLVSPYTQFYDLTILLLPILVTLDRTIAECGWTTIAAAGAFVSMLAISYCYEHFYLVVFAVAGLLWAVSRNVEAKSFSLRFFPMQLVQLVADPEHEA